MRRPRTPERNYPARSPVRPGSSGTLAAMAEKDSGDEHPSLEIPSLGFGRKRKRKRDAPEEVPEPPAASEPSPDPAPESVPIDKPEPEPVLVPEPEPEPVTETVPDAVPEPQPEPEPVLVPDPEPEPVTVPDAVPEPEPVTETVSVPETAIEPVSAHEPVHEHTEVLEPVGATAPPLFADEAPVRREHDEPEATDQGPGERKKRREFSLPAVGGMTAALITGVLVGVLTVGLTWASLRLCEVAQGTSSCGNPGFFLLLAIMIAMVLIGGAVLRAFGVPDPGSTSFLGMGLVAVIALLFLGDLLFAWWMILAIPAAGMASYALAHWVTTAFVDPVETNMHR